MKVLGGILAIAGVVMIIFAFLPLAQVEDDVIIYHQTGTDPIIDISGNCGPSSWNIVYSPFETSLFTPTQSGYPSAIVFYVVSTGVTNWATITADIGTVASGTKSLFVYRQVTEVILLLPNSGLMSVGTQYRVHFEADAVAPICISKNPTFDIYAYLNAPSPDGDTPPGEEPLPPDDNDTLINDTDNGGDGGVEEVCRWPIALFGFIFILIAVAVWRR